MRVTSTAGPWLAAALRVFGVMMLLVVVLVPGLAAALEPSPTARADRAGDPLGDPSLDADYGEGGACGEDDEVFEELIDCGSDLEARFDEPYEIAVLRNSVVRTTKKQCEELIADIYSRQTCSAGQSECGTMSTGGMPGPGPKLAGSSASGQSHLATLDVPDADARRLGALDDERMPKLRDLSPPVPPPKLAAR